MSSHKESGFSLVEVTLALGISAMCLVTVLGLIPVGLSSNRASIEQTSAVNIAHAILVDLRTAIAAGSTTTALYQITIPSEQTLYFSKEGSQMSAVSVGGEGASFQVSLSYGVATQGCRSVRIVIGWPAFARPENFSGSYEVVSALGANSL